LLLVFGLVLPSRRQPAWRRVLKARATGNAPEELRLAQRFRRRFPNDPRGWSAVASVHRSQGDLAEAETTLRGGLETHRHDPGLTFDLAFLLISQQRYVQARFILDDLRDWDEADSARADLGFALMAVEEHQPEKVRRYSLAALARSHNPGAHALAGLYLAVVKPERDRAISLLEKDVAAYPDQPFVQAVLAELLKEVDPARSEAHLAALNRLLAEDTGERERTLSGARAYVAGERGLFDTEPKTPS
jgi:predicted Zn-dependent protease